MSIKLTNAAIDIFKRADGEETIIIRGVIDPACYHELLVDTYQREIGSPTKISALADALEISTVPDIELGMRGDKTRMIKTEEEDTVYYLQDPTYIIDGLQRISGGKFLMQTKPGSRPRIGCLVHLCTTFEWERERFRILNQERSKLSINVLLRNLSGTSAGMDMLYKLCGDSSFVLKDRVCWQQKMLRSQIVTALLLSKVTGMLHSNFGPGRSNHSNEIAIGLNKIMEKVGRNTMRENVKQFFDFVDRCWGIRIIVFTVGAAQIKSTFLLSLADIFSRSEVFWKENRFQVPSDLEAKIRKFPIQDPEVSRLAGAGGKAKHLLMSMMLDHINSGKRTRRIKLAGFDLDSGFLEEESEEALAS